MKDSQHMQIDAEQEDSLHYQNSKEKEQEQSCLSQNSWVEQELEIEQMKLEIEEESEQHKQIEINSNNVVAKKEFKSRPVPRILVKELSDNQMFYLIGNIVIHLKDGVLFDDSVYPTQSEDYRVMSSTLKPITSIEDNSKQSKVAANLNLTVKPLDHFQFLIDGLEKVNLSEVGNELIKQLNIYQKKGSKYQKSIMKQVIERASLSSTPIKLLLNQRQAFFKQAEEQLLSQIGCTPQDSFYIASYYSADFAAQELNFSQFQYSYPLISLLGFEPTQFVEGISKKGLQTWMSPKLRTQLIIQLLKDWNELDLGQDITIAKISEFIFKTIDDLLVECPATRFKQKIRYTGELQYIMEGVPDNVTILLMDIDIFTMKKILGMRNIFALKSKTDEFVQDFDYSLESHVFLEKYYWKLYASHQINYQKEQMELDQLHKDELKRCSFRQINISPVDNKFQSQIINNCNQINNNNNNNYFNEDDQYQ